jgi:hypothetical protein
MVYSEHIRARSYKSVHTPQFAFTRILRGVLTCHIVRIFVIQDGNIFTFVACIFRGAEPDDIGTCKHWKDSS